MLHSRPIAVGPLRVTVTASDPEDKDTLFEPARDKVYRHPTFFVIPDEVGHM